jgi:NAD(P)-dependent dehydrogenase (short-subunit alcohol dehydrogenase family)
MLIEGDVGIEETALRAVAAILDRFGRLDALVAILAAIRRASSRCVLPQSRPACAPIDSPVSLRDE